jgi:predicted DNA-binding transcriptional regulator AlpA
MSADVLTVDEFCLTHKICRATFYNLQKQNRAPNIMRVGSRVLISRESAAAWRRQMETTSEPGSA